MIADDIWDMILGKAGRLPGKLAPEIIEKAEREGNVSSLKVIRRITIPMPSTNIAN